MDTTFLQQAFSDSQVLTVPWSIDYFSVVVGVLTGALFACDRNAVSAFVYCARSNT